MTRQRSGGPEENLGSIRLRRLSNRAWRLCARWEISLESTSACRFWSDVSWSLLCADVFSGNVAIAVRPKRIEIRSTMNSYSRSGSPLLQPGIQRLDSYRLLLRAYRASGKLEPPDEERVEDERDRNPQLSLLELEDPPHDIEDE